ncbi:hypothetical protein [Trueperella sp. LYQ141]
MTLVSASVRQYTLEAITQYEYATRGVSHHLLSNAVFPHHDELYAAISAY